MCHEDFVIAVFYNHVKKKKRNRGIENLNSDITLYILQIFDILENFRITIRIIMKIFFLLQFN